MNKEERLKNKIKELKREINSIDEMFPGSISKQFNICGNPDCRCKDKDKPVKHGPYYNLSYTFRGKSHTKFIRQELVKQFKGHTRNYKRFKACSDELIRCNVELINLRSIR